MGSVHFSGKNQRSIFQFPSSFQPKGRCERVRLTTLSEHKIKLLKRQLLLFTLKKKKVDNAWNIFLCYFFWFSIQSGHKLYLWINTETIGWVSQIWMHKSRKDAPARKGASKRELAGRGFLGQSLKQLWLEIWPRKRDIITNLGL